VLVSLDLGLE